MPNNIHSLRSVLVSREQDFGLALGKVLSPSQPLQSEEFLKGREDQLAGIKRALYQHGRHVLIHGLRGVGKSSLAQTAAFQLADGVDPVILSCDERTTLYSIIKEVSSEILQQKPTLRSSIAELNISFRAFGLQVGGRVQEESGTVEESVSINEAARLLQFLAKEVGQKLVVVVDEFDQVTSKKEQQNFANFIKHISDKHVPSSFIFCGIGESIDRLMAAHESADRYFHTVSLGRLPWEARFDIVTAAAEVLGIEIDNGTIVRIARIRASVAQLESKGIPKSVNR